MLLVTGGAGFVGSRVVAARVRERFPAGLRELSDELVSA